MFRSIGRERAVPVIVAALCIVALATVGLRYVLLRADRRSTEHTVADADRRRHARGGRPAPVGDRDAASTPTTTTPRCGRNATGSAPSPLLLHADLDRARADTTASAIGAFVSGSQANDLSACLTGVSQALNQLSVGDGRSIAEPAEGRGPVPAGGHLMTTRPGKRWLLVVGGCAARRRARDRVLLR